MMDRTLDNYIFIAENAQALKLVERVKSIMVQPENTTKSEETYVLVGSVEHLIEYKHVFPAIYVLCLGGLGIVIRLTQNDNLTLSQILKRLLIRDTRNSVWPIANANTPNLLQKLHFYSPLEMLKISVLVCHALKANNEGYQKSQLWHLDFITQKTVLEENVLQTLCEWKKDKKTGQNPLMDHGRKDDYSPDRHLSLDDIGPKVESYHVSSVLGLLSEPSPDLDAPVAGTIAKLNIEGIEEIITLGRGANYKQAKYVTILETIERYAGLTSAHYVDTWMAKLTDIDQPKLDPRELGLHLDSSYDKHDFLYSRYTEDMPIDWTWGKCLHTNKKVAVPSCFAYYGGNQYVPKVRLVNETSNGCAIGTTVAEASLHAIIELVERDAFLMTWYKQRSLDDITHLLLEDEVFRWSLRKIEMVTNMKIRVLDSTQAHGIPTVICLATGDSLPSQVFGAGSGLDFVSAAVNALAELCGHCLFLKQRFTVPETTNKAYDMLENSNLVISMEDHGYVMALPESREYTSFINHNAEKKPKRQSLDSILSESKSVEQSLAIILERLSASGLNVFTVEQNVPEMAETGLFCVKAICPGLLPMTFGHQNRRVNFPRIGDLSKQRMAEALPPHPFM